jgi:elongation factor 1-beta
MMCEYIALLTHLDDETDMKELEKSVRSIEKDGLVWGASTLVPVGFGIKKLQINVCHSVHSMNSANRSQIVIEDDKISLTYVY